MGARKYKGGGWFSDDVTGRPTILSNIIIGIFVLIILSGIGTLVYFMLNNLKNTGGQPSSEGGGAVGPPTSSLPGQIVISNILGAPSAGQAIVYFSKKESVGTTCDDCNVQFDVTLTYSGGSPQQEPKYITLTAPISSGTLLIPYGESASGFSPLQPGHMGPTAPPTSVLIKVDARVMSRENPAMKGGLTTFSKTIPYTA